MPTRLTRYILAEILKIFSVALLVLTVLILLIGVGRELLREGLGVMAVLSLLPYVLPMSLQFALPATMLFSVCCVYGRMSADGEISTIKASGISPLRVMQPAFVFAALLSPFAVYLSDIAVSWGRPGAKQVMMHSIEDVVYRMLRAQRSYSSPKGFSIHVLDVDGRRLLYPTVTMHLKSSGEPVTWTAREGGMSLNPTDETLTLRVVDCRVSYGDRYQAILPDGTEIPIPLDMVLRKGSVSSTSPSELPLRVMGPEAIRQERANEANRQRLAAQTGFSLISARWGELGGPRGQTLENEIHAGEARLIRLRTEPWRRWAGGFSCFFFVLVGVPLAIRMKSADYWTSFGMCFVPILLVYYPLLQFGLDSAKDGTLPPYCVWMGNGLLLTAGGFLTKHVYRY
ncbi:LptF/LptG family permease [Candidatus Laterigemmans baculatus]|uniref:LptF/LptG family permease n=1 Tax=Candidatus Laterigemmans baculatus TaxID=2770505 RepID=UPI0013DA0A6A|nr:LptF/LptG family permease [Candidatus Laterigemmans baculatus]